MSRKLRKSSLTRAAGAPPRPAALPSIRPSWLPALRGLCVCGLLAAAVAVAFLPALRMPFLHFDDDIYVWGEPHVIGGFTAENWDWAWTKPHAANWHPLTTLSHMLDCQLFGVRPWGHHLVNLLLHALAAMLVFLVLKQMIGRFWAAAAVAAVFAVHPLRVESVVWVADARTCSAGSASGSRWRPMCATPGCRFPRSATAWLFSASAWHCWPSRWR